MNLPALDRLGRPGIAGLGLLLFALSFWLGSVRPAAEQLASLEEEAQRLAPPAGTAAPATAAAPGERPDLAEATRRLRVLVNLASSHGVSSERATFDLNEQQGERRLSVLLPLQGDYPSLRAYLHAVLEQPQPPALDELLLQRPQAGEALLQARLRFSYALGAGP